MITKTRVARRDLLLPVNVDNTLLYLQIVLDAKYTVLCRDIILTVQTPE